MRELLGSPEGDGGSGRGVLDVRTGAAVLARVLMYAGRPAGPAMPIAGEHDSGVLGDGRILYDMKSDAVLRFRVTFPDGEVWFREWTVEELDDVPEGLRPGQQVPGWLTDIDIAWESPLSPVSITARVKETMTDEARDALGL